MIEEFDHSIKNLQNTQVIVIVLQSIGSFITLLFAFLNKRDAKVYEEKRKDRELDVIRQSNDYKLAQDKLAFEREFKLAELTAKQTEGIQKHITSKTKEVANVVSMSKEERKAQLDELFKEVLEAKELNKQQIDVSNHVNMKIEKLGIRIAETKEINELLAPVNHSIETK